MKYFIFTLFCLFLAANCRAQHMTNAKIETVLYKLTDSINGRPGNWQFILQNVPMFCITDEAHNRMRIISPITKVADLTDDLLRDSLIANFHTALDVKYAISQEVLWSVFIHPLKELSDDQLMDAISQVRLAALTFGSTFTSTELLFGGGNSGKPVIKKADTTQTNKTYKF